MRQNARRESYPQDSEAQQPEEALKKRDIVIIHDKIEPLRVSMDLKDRYAAVLSPEGRTPNKERDTPPTGYLKTDDKKTLGTKHLPEFMNSVDTGSRASGKSKTDFVEDAVLEKLERLKAEGLLEEGVAADAGRVDAPPLSPNTAGRSSRRNPRGQSLIPKQYRMTPNIAAALEKAAKAEGVSVSRFLNDFVSRQPEIMRHLE